MAYEVIILIVLIALSAFFSASEVAFITLSDAKIESMLRRKTPGAQRLKKLKSNNRRLLITILIGNNIVNIASASIATVVMTEIFQSAAIGITTGVMTLVVLIFGEIIPKAYAHNHPKKFALLSSRYLQMLQWISKPLVIIFEWLSNVLAGKQTDQQVSEEEFRALAQVVSKQGGIEKREGMMIERLFDFNDITAEDIMTPRVNVAYLEDKLSIEACVEVIKDHPHTRFPIVHETPDNVTGFVHSRDVLLAYNNPKQKKESIESIKRPILSVPKQVRIDELLREFQKKQTHIALVLDEYGGTEGIVTLEDVLEELVGEITDEHDVEDNIIKRVNKDSIIVSGEEELRDINDFLNCAIPGDPLDTIAEVILDTLQKIPRKNNEVLLGDINCKIIEVKNKSIQKVLISKKK